MGKVVKMSGAKKSARGPNSPGGAKGSDGLQANFSARLFLIVDIPTFTMIEWLRESLEAHSYGDVVRQAVRAFAIRFAERGVEAVAGCALADDCPDGNQKLKRLNIRVPGQTKIRLDFLKDRTGMSFTDIIVCGLQLLSVRAKDEEALLSDLEMVSRKGGEDDAMETPISLDGNDRIVDQPVPAIG